MAVGAARVDLLIAPGAHSAKTPCPAPRFGRLPDRTIGKARLVRESARGRKGKRVVAPLPAIDAEDFWAGWKGCLFFDSWRSTSRKSALINAADRRVMAVKPEIAAQHDEELRALSVKPRAPSNRCRGQEGYRESAGRSGRYDPPDPSPFGSPPGAMKRRYAMEMFSPFLKERRVQDLDPLDDFGAWSRRSRIQPGVRRSSCRILSGVGEGAGAATGCAESVIGSEKHRSEQRQTTSSASISSRTSRKIHCGASASKP